MHGHEIPLLLMLGAARGPDVNRRNPFLIGGIHDHPLGAARDFVHLFLHGDAVGQVLEVHHAGDFREDRERIRIPFEQDVVGLDARAVLEMDPGAVDHLIALFFAALVVEDRDDAVAVHGDQLALGVLDRLNGHEFDEAVGFRVLLGLLRRTGGGAADVEGAHGELGARLPDGLRGDDAHGFAAFDHAAGGEIASVAKLANAAPGFAGQHGADFDALNAGGLDRRRPGPQ